MNLLDPALPRPSSHTAKEASPELSASDLNVVEQLEEGVELEQHRRWPS